MISFIWHHKGLLTAIEHETFKEGQSFKCRPDIKLCYWVSKDTSKDRDMVFMYDNKNDKYIEIHPYPIQRQPIEKVFVTNPMHMLTRCEYDNIRL